MATVKVFNDMFDEKSEEFVYDTSRPLLEQIEEHLDKDFYKSTMVECYDPQTGETFYAPMEDDDETEGVIILVNGQSVDKDFVPEEHDVVNVIFTPLGGPNATKGAVMGTLFGSWAGVLTAAALFVFGGPTMLITAGVAIGLTITGAFAGGIIGYAIGREKDKAKAGGKLNQKDGKDSDQLPDVRGCSNQSLVGNNFPYVIGKHLVTPFIVGDPYTFYVGDRGKDAYIRTLLCVGYGPLKLTDFKLGDYMLAYNRTHPVNIKSYTTMPESAVEGMVVKYTGTTGTYVNGKYYQYHSGSWGVTTEYRDTATGSEVVRNTMMAGLLTGYSTGGVPDNGDIVDFWSNNSVSIEIIQQSNADDELGYGTAAYADQVVNGDTYGFGTLYPEVTKEQKVDANCFYIADKELQDNVPVSYKGVSFPNKYRTNTVILTDSCPREFTINLDLPSGLYRTRTETSGNTSQVVYSPITLWMCIQWRVYSTENASSKADGSDYNDWNTVYFNSNINRTFDNTSPGPGLAGNQTFDKNLHQGNDFGSATLEDIYQGFRDKELQSFYNYAGENGIDEMRFSATVTLTKEQCKQVIADTNPSRCIEVRCLRVSPNYMNQLEDNTDDGKGMWSYSDHIKVSTVVTKTFDYEELRDNDELIPTRVVSEKDLRKLCFVAISCKADASGFIQSNLDQITCTAESFSPIWDSTEKKILPEGITKVEKYYGYFVGNTNTRTNRSTTATEREVTKADYEQARHDGYNWYAEKCGSNFTELMKDIAMVKSNVPYHVRSVWWLPDAAKKYNDNLSSSSFLLSLFGAQNGPEGSGMEDLNVISIADWAETIYGLEDGSTAPSAMDYNGVHYNTGDILPVRYEANAYIYAGIKIEDLLQKIAFTGRAVWVVDESGKVKVVFDGPVPYTKGAIASENCISSSNAYTYEEPPAGLFTTFHDENDGYENNSFYVWSDGNSMKNHHGAVEQFSADFVTNNVQMHSLARYSLANRILNREVLTRKIGPGGAIYSLGDVVLIQGEDLLIGDVSGRVQEVIEDDEKIYGFITDAVYTYTGETVSQYRSTQGVTVIQQRYSGRSNAVTFRLSAPVTKEINGKTYVLQPGETNLVLFAPRVVLGTETWGYDKGNDDPSPSRSNQVKYNIKTGDIAMYGLADKISAPYRIIKIKPEANGCFTETLIPYNEDLYNYGAALPTFQSYITPPPAMVDPTSVSDVPTTLVDQNDSNKSIYKVLFARVAELYANHIVTLYKYSETDLSTAGIGTTLVYDFSDDSITWGDPSLNNGWSATVPNDLTDIWVTSATAYGQSQTDTINSNEWARPIKVGQNGVNGLNTCTISLYKRLSTAPQDLPAAVTYNFANASMVCSNWNGWSTSIPEVDDEDFTPCWEIHATALSTQTTDTIESSEWSECAKILSEGLSKQDVLGLIGERINETPNVLFTPSEGMFAVDEDGVVSTPQTAFMDVRVIQNDEDIAFSFGQIDLPTGMTVSATVLEQGTRLNFTVAQGTRLERNVIKVPVIFTAYADNDVLVDENGNPLVWVEDEDGRWYGDCSSVASLPVAVSGGFIYWNGIDTTASEELVDGGVFYEGTFYTYNGTKWKESKVKPIGIQTEATSPTTYDVYYTASIVKGGRYDGGITTVASIPSNPVIGDYFTWTGADQTPYEGSGFTKLASGCVYKWNGSQWEKDTSGKHLGTALPDILEVAESELVENNSDVVEKVGKMIAWDVVTQNIKVTGEALINSAIIADLTLGDSSHPNSGSFKSWNYVQGSDGFKLNPNGTAELNDVIIRGTVYASAGSFTGDITAEHLYLGSGATVPTSKVDGINEYVHLGSGYGTQTPSTHATSYIKINSNGTLEADNAVIHGTIYATNGEFTGTVHATDGEFEGSLKTTNFSVLETVGVSWVRQNSYYADPAQIWGMIVFFWQALGTVAEKNNPVGWQYDKDVTFTLSETQKLYVYSNRRPYNHYITKVRMNYATGGTYSASGEEFVKITLWDENGSSFDYIDLSYHNWQSWDIGDLNMVYYISIENNAQIQMSKLSPLPIHEQGVITNYLYLDNGILKITDVVQPWFYKRYPKGTDYKTIYDEFQNIGSPDKPIFFNSLYVSCIGYYGKSDSGHARCICGISLIGGTLKFVNVNETVYITISENIKYGQDFLDGELGLFFITPQNYLS